MTSIFTSAYKRIVNARYPVWRIRVTEMPGALKAVDSFRKNNFVALRIEVFTVYWRITKPGGVKNG